MASMLRKDKRSAATGCAKAMCRGCALRALERDGVAHARVRHCLDARRQVAHLARIQRIHLRPKRLSLCVALQLQVVYCRHNSIRLHRCVHYTQREQGVRQMRVQDKKGPQGIQEAEMLR